MNAWTRNAREPQRRRKSSEYGIAFDRLPELVAREIRYVAGRQISSGAWTPNRRLEGLLRGLVTAVEGQDVQSLLDRSPSQWAILAMQHLAPSLAEEMTFMINTFFRVLVRGLTVDPWNELVWYWVDSFEHMLEGPVSNRGVNLHWGKVNQEWLRDPCRLYAKQCLQSGDRSWATLSTWLQALQRLSNYLTTEGIDEPALLDRAIFIDYLVHLRENGVSKHTLAGVNSVASMLAAVQQDGFATFGSPVFLRWATTPSRRNGGPSPTPSTSCSALMPRS